MPPSPSPLPPPRLAALDAVRRGRTTVNALASELGVTDNAVRLHLSALERDGQLARRGPQRSGRVGQPAAEYELTAEGELALSHAYPAALVALVSALATRFEARTRRALYADAGKRLAHGAAAASHGALGRRAEACAALINGMGGSATVEVRHAHAVIVGAGCPLAAAVRSDPTVCTVVESLLERHAAVRATMQCEHGAHPSCRFRLTAET